MCLVITIDDKGVDVIDVGRLRSQIKETNILSQWNTSYVPTQEPTTEPTVLALVEDVVVCKFMHSCAPSLNPAR